MVSNVMKDRLLSAIEGLSEEQVSELIEHAESMQPETEQGDYDPSTDPLIGFLDGDSTDLSIRAKQILRDEIDSESGWTNKNS